MKSEATAGKLDVTRSSPKVMKVKLANGRGFFKVGIEKKHGEANLLHLEINGSRKFEIGNDCDTCHFWFKCLHEPKMSSQKKVLNLPKTVQLPRPIDELMVQEMSPLLELMEKGEYSVFDWVVDLTGPYNSDDEGSYFFNNEFQELWDVSDPREEGLLSNWEHYEGQRPRMFRHEGGVIEKQYEFIIPLIPRSELKEEYIKIYQAMIANGDRPRILLYGLYHRGIPEAVMKGQNKNLHSFMSGFVLDGHHKLAAYRRAGVPAKFLTILSHKASKYFLLKDEGTSLKNKLDERLAAFAA